MGGKLYGSKFSFLILILHRTTTKFENSPYVFGEWVYLGEQIYNTTQNCAFCFLFMAANNFSVTSKPPNNKLYVVSETNNNTQTNTFKKNIEDLT